MRSAWRRIPYRAVWTSCRKIQGNGSRKSPAGNGREEDREQVLYAVSIVHGEACVSREEVRIDIRMRAYDADDGNDEHRIEKERTQVVTRLEQDPYRSDGSNRDVKADQPHPCRLGEVNRMEVHADAHAEDDSADSHHCGYCHGYMETVYDKAENDGSHNEEHRNHGNGCFDSTLFHIDRAVFNRCAERGSNDGSKGCNDKDQCQVREYDEELLGSLRHIR